jgi:hypothetical protein
MMARKSLNQIYQEKYGTTWGLTDIQKCTFDYKQVFTKDLIGLLFSLTKNQEWIFGGTHPLNKLNQIVHAIRNELNLRKNDTADYHSQSDYQSSNNYSKSEHREPEVNYNR